MTRRTDWALSQAREVYSILQSGGSKEVSINYLAAALRMASQRGGIEAAKAKPPAKETLV